MNQPTYLTGERIFKGDVVKLGQWDAIVEDIVIEGCAGWVTYWRDATGEGVMLVGPAFGRVFTEFHDEDLSFICRQTGP